MKISDKDVQEMIEKLKSQQWVEIAHEYASKYNKEEIHHYNRQYYQDTRFKKMDMIPIHPLIL